MRDNRKVKPYRVEWQAFLTTQFVLVESFDNREEAVEKAQEYVDKYNGRCRILSQHIIEVITQSLPNVPDNRTR